MKNLVLFTFTILSSIPSFAQSPPNTVSDQIVVTASAIPETVESTPASVTVVTKKEIEQRAARDVADVLREVPGFTISRTGSPGRATSLFTRGGNSTHTLVLWNGIEINNPYFAGYDWGRFSTAGVEQIEVVRGPYSALYGSDAVAGVVNILSAPAKSGVSADLEAGGHGLRNAQVATTYASPATQISAAYERRQDDGFEPNDDFRQNSAHLFWRWTSANHFSLGIAARHTAYDLGIPRNLNGAGSEILPSPRRRQDGTETQIAIPLQQTIGRVVAELTLAESRRDDHFEDPDDPFGFVDASTESRTRRARFTARRATVLGTIVVGGEYERAVVDDASNFGVSLEGKRRTDRSLFIEDRYTHALSSGSRLELSAGYRHDRFDTFGSEGSPRIAGAFVTGSHKIRAAYGGAFRAPSIGELYFPFSGNLTLQAEHSNSIEAGYDYALGDRGLFSATLFRSRYRNLIVFDNVTFAFANVGRARTSGAELSLKHEMSNVRVAASYTYLKTSDADDEALLRRPRHSGSVYVGYQLGEAEMNVVLLHTGARDDVLPIAPFSRINDRAYTTIDVNTQRRFGRLTPYLKIENVTGKKYEEVRGYTSPGRRGILGLRFAM
jgi:vitamin B12 transporter